MRLSAVGLATLLLFGAACSVSASDGGLLDAFDVPHLFLSNASTLPGLLERAPPIPVLGVVAYRGGDLLLRCVRSVDHPVRNLVIIVNGDDPDVACAVEVLRTERTDARILLFPENLGVSGSWNAVLREVAGTGEGSPLYWVMAASDSKFEAGTLRRLAAMMASFEETGSPLPPIVHFASAGGMCQFHTAWALTRRGRQLLGDFDENYHPYGGEDSDWEHRRRLAGIALQVFVDLVTHHGPDNATAYVSGSYTAEGPVRRSAFRRQQARQDHVAYFLAKWGDGPFPAGLYPSPFDDGGPPGGWALDAVRRRYVETGRVHLDGRPLPPAIDPAAWPHDAEAPFPDSGSCAAPPEGAPRVLFVQPSVVRGFFPNHRVLPRERARELGVAGGAGLLVCAAAIRALVEAGGQALYHAVSPDFLGWLLALRADLLLQAEGLAPAAAEGYAHYDLVVALAAAELPPSPYPQARVVMPPPSLLHALDRIGPSALPAAGFCPVAALLAPVPPSLPAAAAVPHAVVLPRYPLAALRAFAADAAAAAIPPCVMLGRTAGGAAGAAFARAAEAATGLRALEHREWGLYNGGELARALGRCRYAVHLEWARAGALGAHLAAHAAALGALPVAHPDGPAGPLLAGLPALHARTPAEALQRLAALEAAGEAGRGQLAALLDARLAALDSAAASAAALLAPLRAASPAAAAHPACSLPPAPTTAAASRS